MPPPVSGSLRFIADDVGASEGVDSAIVELCAAKLVSTAAVLANRLLKSTAFSLERLGCEISVHLNVTSGQPISHRDAIRSLVTSSGDFRAPKDYVRNGDQSPLDAVRRYHIDAVPNLDASQLLWEFRAQRDFCRSIASSLSRRYSLHHDLDQVGKVRATLESVWPEFVTRQCELDRGALSGYGYLFALPDEPVDSYTIRLVQFLRQSAARSARCHGVPYEIAVHPACNANSLEDFTVYRAGRVTEYLALVRIADSGLLSDFDQTLGTWQMSVEQDF